MNVTELLHTPIKNPSWRNSNRRWRGGAWADAQMHTNRKVPGCQRCQWALHMRADCHTLHSCNGQADGRLLCSLCLSWWLYSSGCCALPAALHWAHNLWAPFLSHFLLLPPPNISYLFLTFVSACTSSVFPLCAPVFVGPTPYEVVWLQPELLLLGDLGVGVNCFALIGKSAAWFLHWLRFWSCTWCLEAGKDL